MADHSTLSSRGANAAREAAPPFLAVLTNPYSEENRDGYLSLGLAENALMHKEVEEFIFKSQLRITSQELNYGELWGSQRLREGIASLINTHFHPHHPITPSHILVTAGVTNAIESTVWSLADAGDTMLLGRPYYGAFPLDVDARAKLKTAAVSFGAIDPFSLEAVAEYEKALIAAHEKGERVRLLMLCSPHNPLGRCYPRTTLIALMRFCQKHQIHLVSDEIYALSVWDNPEVPDAVGFTSVLAIEMDDIIDPGLVHVLWGMSKDFCANGLRIGCLISPSNSSFLDAARSISIFTTPSSASTLIANTILHSPSFLATFIPTNRARISAAYAFTTNFLKKHSIPFLPGANAGFFIWAQLSAYPGFAMGRTQGAMGNLELHDETKNDDGGKDGSFSGGGDGLVVEGRGESHGEDKATRELDDEIERRLWVKKVFLARGRGFGAEGDGWFRIVCTHERVYLKRALGRVVEALEGEGLRGGSG